MKVLTLLGATLAYSVLSMAAVARQSVVNPFDGKKQFVNPDYAGRVAASALAFNNSGEGDQNDLYDKAIQIQHNYPTWTWLDAGCKVPKVTEYLRMIRDSKSTDVIATFVIYNLPDRECGTTKHRGELENTGPGENSYMGFIDDIKTAVSKFPEISVAFIIEPGSISNSILYGDDPRCAAADPMYQRMITYAITTLSLTNIYLYLDGGDSGTLGWDDKINVAAKKFTSIYNGAEKPGNLRGLALNVGRYNTWSLEECTDPNSKNKNCDEVRFAHALSPLLKKLGWDGARFIIDQSRGGVPPTAGANLTHNCNILGTGFGIPPWVPTNDSLADSFVWAKPGGVSDGTNDRSSPNYDPNCDVEESFANSPEYGLWFQEFFKQLVRNAHPPIGLTKPF